MTEPRGAALAADALFGCRASRTCRTGRLGWGVAIALHVAVLGWLMLWDPPRVEPRLQRPPVKVRLVARQPEPPPPPKAPPPPVVEQVRPAPVVPRPVPRRAPAPPRAPRTATPAPTPAPAPAQPPGPAPTTPPRFSVDLSATVPSGSGGVAVPTAPPGSARPIGAPSWAREPDAKPGPAAAAGSAGPAGPARPLEVTEISSPPRLVSQPSREDLRAAYPPRARADGLEANVVLKILVGARGRVERVRVVRGAGNGFDDAAARLVRRFRFEAGTKDGKPVAVWIPWTYKFRLNG